MQKVIKNKLTFNLLVQISAVIFIIAMGFYWVTEMQSEQLKKKLQDKAEIFSIILSTNLDKIIGDNLLAYKNLQEATLLAMNTDPSVESIRIISKDLIILSSSVAEESLRPVNQQYQSILQTVLQTHTSKSLTKSRLGKENIIHYLPVFSKGGGEKNLLGILQIIVRFPSQQGQMMAALRSNKQIYFKEQAHGIAKTLAFDLEYFIKEASRNFGYLQNLISNMLKDDDVDDIHLYSDELDLLITGKRDSPARFLSKSKNLHFDQAMKKQEMVLTPRKDALQITSPLYLSKSDAQYVGGAISITFSLQNTYALISQMRSNILLMSFVIILAFCLIIGLFFRRKILNPISEFMILTNKIKNGDLSSRLKLTSQDEIGTLSIAFNSMLDEVEKSRKAMDEFNIRLQTKVDEVTGELVEKQDQLLRSEKMASLGVLSSGIAHEINNPLGVILGHTQMLLKEFKERGSIEDPKEAKDLLSTIEQYTKRCSHIVKSLLHFTRDRAIEPVPVNIVTALDNAFNFTSERLAKKNIQVTKKIPKEVPSIQADAIQLEQVFINIILNAEQSMKDEGRINITIEEEKPDSPENLLITFADTGDGINDQYLNKIFDPFFSTKEPGEGVGLGLSISYGIIKAHEGTIDVQSEQGKGTTVTIKLPLRR